MIQRAAESFTGQTQQMKQDQLQTTDKMSSSKLLKTNSTPFKNFWFGKSEFKGASILKKYFKTS